MTAVDADRVQRVTGDKLEGLERGRRPGPELAGLGDRPARELGPADPGGEPDVVLDAPRHPRLAPDHRGLDDEGVQAFRGAVDRRTQAGRAGTDDREVGLL